MLKAVSSNAMATKSGKRKTTRAQRGSAAQTPAADTRVRSAWAAAELPEDELPALTLRACLIARDAVFNVRDLLAEGSRLAFLAIKDCEKELDQIERKIDEQLPGAITRVGEAKARELLACLKFITDLERIGDLAYSAVMQLESRREKLPAADAQALIKMAALLCEMLEDVHQGFLTRDPSHAHNVLRLDPEVDRLCHALFQRHLAAPNKGGPDERGSNTALSSAAGPGRAGPGTAGPRVPAVQQNFDILLAAQALERIGDHAKNLAEEIYGLAEGRSLRHNARKLAYS
jgi:phosphate transport system protein